MKLTKSILIFAAILGSAFVPSSNAATPEVEKAFVDGYKKALEAGDAKALAGFLSTEGAEAETVEFFKLMQAIEPGAKVISIELVKPEAAEAEKLNGPMPMPDGKNYKMPLKITKQLVIKTETKSADGSSSGSTKCAVAEKGGKLVIPVPVPVKGK